MMRNITTCYSEHAVKLSNSYCSGPSNPYCSGPSNRVSVSRSLIPSIQNAVTCIYRAELSTTRKKLILVRITWYNPVGSGFSICVTDDDSRFSRNSKKLQKIKGSKTFECCNSKFEVIWDLSQAIYDVGPEPVGRFYVVVFVNSDVILFLGENEESEVKKQIKGHLKPKDPKFSLFSRIEQFSGNAHYSTRVKFCDTGAWHDILIKCTDSSGPDKSILCVSIDKKDVIEVKKLRWNFRGNQTIFVDKIQVDMMWDVHDWFFNPTRTGYAIFMFKTRTGFDGRLWLEEKIVEDKHGFSLLVCAGNNST